MVSLRKLVRLASRKINWVLGKFQYDGHQGYKCPTDLYHRHTKRGVIKVEYNEDGAYRFYVSVSVYFDDKHLAEGSFEYGMGKPIDVEALFIGQLIIDLTNMEVDAALEKFNASCSLITLEQLEQADLLGYLSSCPVY